MKFSAYLPPQAEAGSSPDVLHRSGLTCYEVTFMVVRASGVFRQWRRLCGLRRTCPPDLPDFDGFKPTSPAHGIRYFNTTAKAAGVLK